MNEKLALILGCDRDPESIEHAARTAVEAMEFAGRLLDATGATGVSHPAAPDDLIASIEHDRDEAAQLRDGLRARLLSPGADDDAATILAKLDDLLTNTAGEALLRHLGSVDVDVVERHFDEAAQNAATIAASAEAREIVSHVVFFLGCSTPSDVKANLAMQARTIAAIELLLGIDPTVASHRARWETIFRAFLEQRDTLKRYADISGGDL